jgi:hypothetical protein
MNARFLSAATAVAFFSGVAMASAGAAPVSPFLHERLGQCFPSEREALTVLRVAGSGSTSDENVRAVAAKVSQGSIWAIDKTAGNNYEWLLLEPRNSEYCVTLYIPFAASVDSALQSGLMTIVAKTQASPGGAAYEMQFRRSKAKGRFVPTACKKLTWDQSAKAPQLSRVDCLTVGD